MSFETSLGVKVSVNDAALLKPTDAGSYAANAYTRSEGYSSWSVCLPLTLSSGTTG